MQVGKIIISEAATSKFVTVALNGVQTRLHYNDIRADDKGETVVMLHGSGPGASGWANFSRNIEPFVAAGYRVVLLDSPGWSRSDTVVCNGSRSDLNAAALLGLLDELRIEKAHLVGNSMGAHSAVAFALSHKARTGKLILMGGGAGGGASLFAPTPTEGIKLIGALYRAPTIENLKKMMNVFVYDASNLTDDLFKTRLDGMLQRQDHLENFVKSSTANPKQFPDVAHRLGEIDSAALIIWGRDDRFVPLDTGLRLLAGLKDAQLHVFSQCGHWAQWEHADRFNRLALDFLSEI